MATIGIALMAIMMGGMLLMHFGGRGHSGHGGEKAATSVVASTSTAPGDAPHDHRDSEKRQP